MQSLSRLPTRLLQQIYLPQSFKTAAAITNEALFSASCQRTLPTRRPPSLIPRALSRRHFSSSTHSTPAPPPTDSSFALKHADEGVSFWQPKPACGYVTVNASYWFTPALPFSQGIQVIPPHCYVRPHAHEQQSEIITVVSGHGYATIGEHRYPMRAGTTLSLPPQIEHSFHNASPSEELRFIWTITRPSDGDAVSLEDYFRTIGKPRKPGEPAPQPFERPADADLDNRFMMFANVA